MRTSTRRRRSVRRRGRGGRVLEGLAWSVTVVLLSSGAQVAAGTPAHAETGRDVASAAASGPPVGTLVPLYGGYVDDPAEDAQPGQFDLSLAQVMVDPNTGEARVRYGLRDGDRPFPTSHDLVADIVVRLGMQEGSSCAAKAEIVVNTGSNDTIVRAPGSSDLPPTSPGRSDYIDPPATVSDPVLSGISLSCFSVRLYDQDTLTLRDGSLLTGLPPLGDPYAATFTLDPAPGRTRVRLGVPFDLWVGISHWSWIDQTRLYDRVLTAEPGPGVTVGPFDGNLGNESLLLPSDNPPVPVTVTEPGNHEVTLTVSTANGVSASQTYRFFAPYPPPDWSDPLTGLHVFEPFQGRRAPELASLWFLDGRWAYRGQPDDPPDCGDAKETKTDVQKGCVRYWYDAATRQLQVGDWRGTVHDDHLELDGFDYTHRAVPPIAGKRLDVRVRSQTGYWCRGARILLRGLREPYCIATTTITLHRDGTYGYREHMVDTEGQERLTRSHGTYRFTATGVLRLRAHGKTFASALAALGADPETAVPRPARFGLLWDGCWFAPVR